MSLKKTFVPILAVAALVGAAVPAAAQIAPTPIPGDATTNTPNVITLCQQNTALSNYWYGVYVTTRTWYSYDMFHYYFYQASFTCNF